MSTTSQILPITTEDEQIKKRRRTDAPDDAETREIPFNPRTQLICSDYTVGWICALPVELVAAKAMLDAEHAAPPAIPTSDKNIYCLGSICGHNVVIVCLAIGRYGTTSAAIAAEHMMSTFTSITTPLMVGIGGGAPRPGHDIRLGDVVISTPSPESQAVVQYDFGKTMSGGISEPRGTLNKPRSHLLQAVAQLRAKQQFNQSEVPRYISIASGKNHSGNQSLTYPGADNDILVAPVCASGEQCIHEPSCSEESLLFREARSSIQPVIHYGTIASGNQVIKDAGTRNRLAIKFGALCFEMEAAGLIDELQCLVVRGISDYCDKGKTKIFQGYAAVAAAAVAKELLSIVPVRTVVTNPMQSTSKIMANRRDVMDALDFAQSDNRRATVERAHAQTCEWIFEHPDFLSWLDANMVGKHRGLLWIKGNPGTGKSTIMKYILERMQMQKWNQRDSNLVIVSFFFNARGLELERTIIGMYRSLLHQLLKEVPEMQGLLDNLRAREISTMTQVHFENHLIHALNHLGMRRLFCFVDALDECPEDEARSLVRLFVGMAELARSQGLILHVLFASRPYPNISIEKAQVLYLEKQDGHSRDLINYIDAELRIVKSQESNAVKRELLRKSNGIFLWVILVVRILQTEYDKGRIRSLAKKLDTLPPKLSELFRDILTRDGQCLPELLLCMQWILYAARPLHREEFYFAMQAGEGSDDASTWDPEIVTVEVMDNFLLDTSKGLAEMTRDDNPTVQFIHESVREFLLQPELPPELHSISQALLAGPSHERLKECCERQMISSEATFKNYPLPQRQTSSDSTVGTRYNSHPFLWYAVKFLLHHANAADHGGISQLNYIETLLERPWLKWSNILPGYATGHIEPASYGSLMIYTALEGLKWLLILQIRRLQDPIGMIRNALETLMRVSGFARFKSSGLLCEAFHESSGNEHTNFLQPLLDLIRQEAFLQSGFKGACIVGPENFFLIILDWYKSLSQVKLDEALVLAAYFGNRQAVAVLHERGANINGRDKSARTPLFEAAWNGQKEVIEFLCDHGAILDARDTNRSTPLFFAAQAGHKAVVELLCAKGATVNVQNLHLETPLFVAVTEDRKEPIVRFLCRMGAYVHNQDNIGNTPLFYACAISARLLVEYGADLEIRNHQGWTPLLAATKANNGLRLTSLLILGAKPNVHDSDGNTPLHLACKGELGADSVMAAEYLLSRGASLDCVNKKGQTPLQCAALNGLGEIHALLHAHATVPAIPHQVK